MLDVLIMFSIPFMIGMLLGFCFKGFINRYEKRRELDRHMDSLFNEVNNE